tara:strand:+ start:337 stop:690 length:354 start_codon:yes stop_codon:yes gene_type:complete
MAVPDFSTVLSKTHLDQGSDDPSQARVELLNAITMINDILSSRGLASGLADLDSSGKIPSARLTDLISDTELKTNSVTTDKVQDGAVNFYKMKATITSSTSVPTGGTSGDMHFIVAS